MRIPISLLVLALSMSLGCAASPTRSRSETLDSPGEAPTAIQEPESSGVDEVGMLGMLGSESLLDDDACPEEAIRAFVPGPGELEILNLETEVSFSMRPEDSHGQETICEPAEDDEACLQRGLEEALDGRPGWAHVYSNLRSPEERILHVESLVDGEPMSMTVADADALVAMVRMFEEEGKEVSVLSTELRPAVEQRVAVVSVGSPDAEAERELHRTMWCRWWPEAEGPDALVQARESAEAAGLTLLEASADPEGGYLLSVTCP